MRTGLRHHLFSLAMLATTPVLAQAQQRATLGAIIPCQALDPVIVPGLAARPMPSGDNASPGGARPAFGAPRGLDENLPPSKRAPASRADVDVQVMLQDRGPDSSETIPFAPRPLPATPAPSAAPTPEVTSSGPETWSADDAGAGYAPAFNAAPPGRIWIVPEFLYWQVQGQRVPPLVTTAPIGTPLPVAGTLGNPGTRVIFGGDRINDPWRAGMRLRGGFWFDTWQTRGIDASGFFLDQGTTSFQAGLNGNPGVFRPFFNANGAANAELIAFQNPGLVPGTLTPLVAGQVIVHAHNSVSGADVNYRQMLMGNGGGRIDLLLGYRRLDASDALTVAEGLVTTNANPPPGFPLPGTLIFARDAFRTTNAFNGGQLGLTGERWRGLWYVSWTGKVGLGDTHRVATIDGLTQILPTTGGASTMTGGLLAQSSNIGRHSSDAFSVVPEIGLNVGRQLTPRLRVFAGYTFLYWTDVWRAGDQIDLVLAQLPPQPATQGHPAFLANSSGIWMQGVSVGAEFRY